MVADVEVVLRREEHPIRGRPGPASSTKLWNNEVAIHRAEFAANCPSIIAPTKNWQSAVGLSEDNDFMRLMLAKIDAAVAADRSRAPTRSAADGSLLIK
jgi:hypothetical protein